MKHVLYSLLPDQAAADAALAEIQAEGIPQDRCTVVLHRDRLNPEDLDLAESDARRGMIKGMLGAGAAGAALGGLLAGPFALLEIGVLAGIAFGAGAGAVYGFLGGALAGAEATDPHLQRLADGLHQGQLIVTTECHGLDNEAAVEQILKRHGAIEVHKSAL